MIVFLSPSGHHPYPVVPMHVSGRDRGWNLHVVFYHRTDAARPVALWSQLHERSGAPFSYRLLDTEPIILSHLLRSPCRAQHSNTLTHQDNLGYCHKHIDYDEI